MRVTRILAGAMALVATATAVSTPAQAGGHHEDAWIAGAIGFGVGAIFGGALAQPRYAPQPYYYRPAPPVYYHQAPLYQPAPVYRPYYPQPATLYSARPEPWTNEWYAYCDARYRSFDPSTGYFLGYDGEYHFCR